MSHDPKQTTPQLGADDSVSEAMPVGAGEETAATATSDQQDTGEKIAPDSPSAQTPPRVSRKGDSITGTILICTTMICLVMGYFLHNRIAALEAVSSSSTGDIIVIDYQNLFANLPEDVTGEEAERVFSRVNERILSLQDAGFIVLNANAVLAAPPDTRLDGSLLLTEEP
ncbi:hypothetical protein ACT3UJ_06845 [Halomonas sp. 86]|uniref:hypothetical protein n=1 Tax=unclassified Halomonas TaxID=2609666 RepID=UPI0040334CD9